jgi:GH25 family lysozyme M1 (1,4-beta-N-acetylmuramidase)
MFKLSGVALFATSALAAMPKGIDVSGYQPNVNWNTVKSNGVTWAYIKATEGTS